MTFDQFSAIYNDTNSVNHPQWRHEQNGPLVLTVEQAWKELSEFITKRWPSDVIFNDANVTTIVEGCLYDTSLMNCSSLAQSAWSRGDQLTKHVPPTAPPAVAEPAPAQPKLEGRDSLGEVATTEKPISSVQSAPKESTALQDGRDYAWNRSNYNNQLEAFKLQARRETPLVNGLPNHAAIQKRFNELKAELDEKINKPKKNDSLQRVHDEAYEAARRAGCTTSKEIENYINAYLSRN